MEHLQLLFDKMHYRYPDGCEALHGISFGIARGEKVALAGANGAGKSTLLLLAGGLLLPDAGEVAVDGIRLARKTLPTVRRSAGIVFQNSDDQLFMPTIAEDVAFGPSNMGLDAGEIRRRVEQALTAVGALELRDRPPGSLSGGQKKRAALATVLSMEPSMLILDEPTSNLDPRARRQMIGLLRRLDRTTLVATHDAAMALDLCPRTIVLNEGRIAADGPTRRIFTDAALLEACGLEPPCGLQPHRAAY